MNPLIAYALKNIWCNPTQDYQPIVKPARITRKYGSIKTFSVNSKRYALPTMTDTYHVFTYGAMHPYLQLNIPVSKDIWHQVITLTTEIGFSFDVYTEDGYLLPRQDMWMAHVKSGLFMIAIKNRKSAKYNLGTGTVYMRTYMNAWYQVTTESHPFISTWHKDIHRNTDAVEVLNYIDSVKNRTGFTWLIVNGYYYDIDGWDAFAASPGDWVEVIHDVSVKRVERFQLDQPTPFMSTVDQAQKYLLHYPTRTNTIDFYDDVDFIVQYDSGAGVYYHRNDPTAVRMLTHKDYSLHVSKVAEYRRDQPTWVDSDKLSIVAIIRHSGTNKPLVYEHHRIHELYKLPPDRISRAMVGIDSTIPEWQAAVLEQSEYTQIMRHQDACLTLQTVEVALGYNAISRILGDTPKPVLEDSIPRNVAMEYLHVDQALVLEYGADGQLLEYHDNYESLDYYVRNANTKSIECWVGSSGDNPDEWYGLDEVVIPEKADFRCYTADMSAGAIIPDSWVDVTGTAAYTLQTTPVRKVIWSVPGNKMTLVRLDTKIVVSEYDITMNDGVLDFAIQGTFALPHETTAFKRNQLVPMGHYEIYLNGRILIPDLDYRMQFPRVIIVNKDYLDYTLDAQHILVVGANFCNPDFSERTKRDSGFVVDGMLSTNGKFNIRDDVVTRFSLHGKLIHRDELNFAEDDTGVIMLPGANGQPFMATEILVPMHDAITGDAMQMRDISRDLDRRIEAYMTNMLPERGDGFYPITRYYPLYSPTTSAIMVAVKSGVIPEEEVRKPLVDMRILTLCDPYVKLWWEFDPANPNCGIDDRFVIVHPHQYMHTVHLDFYQYKFVKRATDLITKGKVTLSHFIQMEDA